MPPVSVYFSPGSPLLYGSLVVVFLDRKHLCFQNFYSTIPVDVVGVKSCVNRFFDVARVPVRITINKLYFVPKRVVSGC